MLNRLILSAYPIKKHPEYETVSLLDTDEKISVPLLRKRLYNVDVAGKLILSLNKEISGLFKDDYDFNDHGIYYDCFYTSNFDSTVLALEKKVKSLQTRILRKPELEAELKAVEKDLQDRQAKFACILVPCEASTKQCDYERFLQYEAFYDPVLDYHKGDINLSGKEFILDIETTGLDIEADEITMLGIKAVGDKTYQISLNPTASNIRNLFQLLEGKTVVGHNLVFDLAFLMHKAGLEFLPDIDVIDTMLLAHISGERRLSLKHLSVMYGNFKGRRNTLNADNDYLVEDLISTECIYNKFKPALTTFAGKLVCNAVKAFAEVKVNGVMLDENKLFEIRDHYSYLDEPKYAFNVNSNRELADYFISNGVRLKAKTERGDYKVDQKTLENFSDNPIVAEYLDYQKDLNIYQKFIHPYCELESFLLRPDIKLFGTETGRLSCSNPNVQQIPNRSLFKDIFRSRFGNDGYIASIDLDQAELRIAALLSNDETYAKALLSNDFHRYVAHRSFEKPESEISKTERHAAKTVNFGGVLYGGSAAGIAWRIKVVTEIVEKIQHWYAKEFIKLTSWIEQQKDLAVKLNRVQTFFGRTRPLHDLRWDQKRRIGVNTSVQSVASDVMLYILTRLSSLMRQQRLRSKILFPVHDELLIDVHKEELDQVIQLLKQAFKDLLKTPIGQLELSKTLPISGTLEWGESWLHLKSDSYKPIGSVKISSLGD